MEKEKKPLSWIDVFYGDFFPGGKDELFQFLKKSNTGYKYVSFNSRIFTIDGWHLDFLDYKDITMPSWQKVYDNKIGNLDKALSIVRNSHYQLLNFNGDIYLQDGTKLPLIASDINKE